MGVGKPDGKKRYFDVAGFIASEAEKLTSLKLPVKKKVMLNGKEEMHVMTVDNWENELGAFREADINKKSFLGKYEADTALDGSSLSVRYSATEENFRTRELNIEFNSENNPVKITAVVASSNVLYSSRQQLIYEPDKGYRISGKQSIRFLKPDSFYVEVMFDSL